jgi:Na+-translocating ferredoxin:NAD+ oxidoreductase RnfG subunit
MKVHWLLPVGAVAMPFAQVAYATQYMTVEQAQRSAFPDAAQFEPVNVSAAVFAAAALPAGSAPKLWRVRAADRAIGWLAVDQVIGKSELITYAVAFDANGAVQSVEVLDYRESHGGEIRLAGWRKQFVGKTAADPVELNKDIKNISGATLSCRHVTEGVQRLLRLNAALRAERPS